MNFESAPERRALSYILTVSIVSILITLAASRELAQLEETEAQASPSTKEQPESAPLLE